MSFIQDYELINRTIIIFIFNNTKMLCDIIFKTMKIYYKPLLITMKNSYVRH